MIALAASAEEQVALGQISGRELVIHGINALRVHEGDTMFDDIPRGAL